MNDTLEQRIDAFITGRNDCVDALYATCVLVNARQHIIIDVCAVEVIDKLIAYWFPDVPQEGLLK